MKVWVRLLGDFCLEVDGRPVPAAAFPRRNGASLVKLLALAPGQRRHREQVMDALWPEAPPEVAANQLHKAAHYARKATGVPACVVLKNDVVSLFPGAEVTVDAHVFETAAEDALASTDDGAAAAALERFGGELLPEDPYEGWAAQPRQRLEMLHRELLRRAGRWADLVALDPTDEEAQLGLAGAMLARGDRAGALRQIDRIEEILGEELGIGLSPEAYDLRIEALDSPVGAPPLSAPPGAAPAPRHAALATQTLRFCRAKDGTRLAYATSGSGTPVVKVANWLTHLDYDWASPVWAHWWRDLSASFRLIRYDERGCGLSDRHVDDESYSLETFVHDLEAVADAAGLERFDLLGISQGGALAVEYASRHPERVRRMVLFGAYAQGRLGRATKPGDLELHAAQVALARAGWGRDDPTFRQLFTSQFMPGGSKELWEAFNELQRLTSSADNAARLLEVNGRIDVRDTARRVASPTLVLHARNDLRVPFEQGRLLASLIPGAQFVSLPSDNHILLADEAAWPIFMAEVVEFLTSPEASPTQPADA